MKLRHVLHCSVALALAWSAAPAHALELDQDADASVDEGDGADAAAADAIVVTGSRIARDGLQAPTPVTLVGAEELSKTAATNIADALSRLPQFQSSLGAARFNQISAADANSGSYLNLRGIGPARSLILLDGQRVPPTNASGSVDVQTLPQMLIQRVEVVTGGASAAYGSDAVSGVVNFILDKRFTGLKGLAQAGVSTFGDAGSYRFGVAGGFGALDDRLHVIASAEHFHQDGIYSQDARRYGAGLYGFTGAGTSADPYVSATNTNIPFLTRGGLLTAFNQRFNTDGSLVPHNRGTISTNNFAVGGDGSPLNGAGITAGLTTSQFFGRASFDVTPSINLFAQASYSLSKTRTRYIDDFRFLGTSLTISADNGFLSDQVQQLIANANPVDRTTPFARYNSDFRPAIFVSDVESQLYTAGFEADLGNSWRMGGYYTHGVTVQDNQANEADSQRLFAALDSVDAGQFAGGARSGNVVCRVTLTHPSLYPDCVPINMFGENRASQEALDYIYGTSIYRVENRMDAFAAEISGTPFSTWAGDVGIAFGAEYRKQSLDRTSNADPAVPTDFTGIRYVTAGAQRSSVTNVGSAKGSFNVKEVFGEISVPLLKDSALGRSLELNGAVRYTDYSTSGGVTTWKVGAVYEPIDWIRIRATQSRDIRAPTLLDLYASSSRSNSALRLRPTDNGGVQQVVAFSSRGNPDLKPERADSTTVGISFTPPFVPGWRMSLDLFNINLEGAIITQSAQLAYNECEDSGRTAAICQYITRAPGGGLPTAMTLLPLNSSSIKTRGVDFETSYNRPLGNGEIGLRLFVNYLDKLTYQPSVGTAPIELAGNANGAIGVPDAAFPRWRGTASIGYKSESIDINVQQRWIGSFLRSTLPNAVYAANRLPNVFYTDVTVAFPVTAGDVNFEPFLNVTDLFNRQAPLQSRSPYPITYPALQSVHDVMGRYFTFGVRLKM